MGVELGAAEVLVDLRQLSVELGEGDDHRGDLLPAQELAGPEAVFAGLASSFSATVLMRSLVTLLSLSPMPGGIAE